MMMTMTESLFSDSHWIFMWSLISELPVLEMHSSSLLESWSWPRTLKSWCFGYILQICIWRCISVDWRISTSSRIDCGWQICIFAVRRRQRNLMMRKLTRCRAMKPNLMNEQHDVVTTEVSESCATRESPDTADRNLVADISADFSSCWWQLPAPDATSWQF